MLQPVVIINWAYESLTYSWDPLSCLETRSRSFWTLSPALGITRISLHFLGLPWQRESTREDPTGPTNPWAKPTIPRKELLFPSILSPLSSTYFYLLYLLYLPTSTYFYLLLPT